MPLIATLVARLAHPRRGNPLRAAQAVLQTRGYNRIAFVGPDLPLQRPIKIEDVPKVAAKIVDVATAAFSNKDNNTLGLMLLGEFFWHREEERAAPASKLERSIRSFFGQDRTISPFKAEFATRLLQELSAGLTNSGLKGVVIGSGSLVTEVGQTDEGKPLITNLAFLVNEEGEFFPISKQEQAEHDPTQALTPTHEYLGQSGKESPEQFPKKVVEFRDRFGDGVSLFMQVVVCLEYQQNTVSRANTDGTIAMSYGLPNIEMLGHPHVLIVSEQRDSLRDSSDDDPSAKSGVFRYAPRLNAEQLAYVSDLNDFIRIKVVPEDGHTVLNYAGVDCAVAETDIKPNSAHMEWFNEEDKKGNIRGRWQDAAGAEVSPKTFNLTFENSTEFTGSLDPTVAITSTTTSAAERNPLDPNTGWGGSGAKDPSREHHPENYTDWRKGRPDPTHRE